MTKENPKVKNNLNVVNEMISELLLDHHSCCNLSGFPLFK